MSDDMTRLTDTRDMICVHDVFRRALADAPGQVGSVKDRNTDRAEKVASLKGASSGSMA